jgi:DNA-binding beta-propeller fold protein YncE
LFGLLILSINMSRLIFVLGLVFLTTVEGQTPKLTQSIPLPGVDGRIDHMCLDAAGGRLFVAALGNNTVEVVDLKAGKVTRSLTGFSEPQGLCFVPEFNRVYIANGGDGLLRVLDGTSFAEVASLKFDGGDADNVRYDTAVKNIYVGYGSGALGIVDAATNAIIGTIPLSAHPESFQLEKEGMRIFVNLPRAHTVAVVDRVAGKVMGHWALGFVASNFPLALDEMNHRAFVACRTPARLLVYDTRSGAQVAKLDLHGDCDDVFYDPLRRQIYASCGEGFIDIFTQVDADHYALRDVLKTTTKARTCYFDGQRIYLAVPKLNASDAKIEIFEIEH